MCKARVKMSQQTNQHPVFYRLRTPCRPTNSDGCTERNKNVLQLQITNYRVLWHCWLGDRKGIQPVKRLGVGLLVVLIWLELCTTYSSSYHHHVHLTCLINITYLLTSNILCRLTHRCTWFRVIVVTDPHTNTQTGPITIHCAAKLSAQCN